MIFPGNLARMSPRHSLYRELVRTTPDISDWNFGSHYLTGATGLGDKDTTNQLLIVFIPRCDENDPGIAQVLTCSGALRWVSTKDLEVVA